MLEERSGWYDNRHDSAKWTDTLPPAPSNLEGELLNLEGELLNLEGELLNLEGELTAAQSVNCYT